SNPYGQGQGEPPRGGCRGQAGARALRARGGRQRHGGRGDEGGPAQAGNQDQVHFAPRGAELSPEAEMKAKDLREKTVAELHQQERDLSEQLFALRLQKVTGQLEKPAKVRTARKDLARVLTVLREKGAGA